MDLRFPDAQPTLAEVQALDAVLGESLVAEGWEREHGGAHRAGAMRHKLLPALHALRDRIGWLSPGGLGELCRRLDVPPAEAYGVATFYALFSLEEQPARIVHVCTDLACQTLGAGTVIDGVTVRCGPPRQTGGAAAWQASPCLGLCERGPAALVTEAGVPSREAVIQGATAASIAAAIDGGVDAVAPESSVRAAVPQTDRDDLVLLTRIGVVDPESIDDYRAHGGYQALRQAVSIGPVRVIEEVSASNLVGRGGAAFPAGRKWAAVAAQAAHPHLLVCNADESEPGTFKDRVLLEGDPFAVVESMTIAAFATGCERGYLYLRGEYPRALHRIEHAIRTARQHGFLGADVMGLGFAFDIEVVRGAGAYICGEETAIFNSIEGYRGEPRSKPPFPVEVGLFGKPTVVNNVETLVNVLPIITHGGAAFAAKGTSGSAGTKLFCVSGSVQRPGVYEVEFGATLRDLLELAGGVPEGQRLRAVLLGGAAGSFVRADEVDFPLTLEGARAHGTTLGSGVVLVLDDSVDLPAFLLRIAEFFRDESCGQCVPCRVDTVRQEEALVRITAGAARDDDELLLRDVGRAMRDASICGLGQTAWNAIESAIDRLGALT